MAYIVPTVRFLFFNGKDRYTVEYTFGLSKWFVFKEEKQTDAVFWKEDKKIKFDKVNKYSAEDILNEYFE